MALNTQGKLFVISAPTAGGKTTIARTVLQQLADVIPISKVITYTTRKPRINEKASCDYHFLSTDDFLARQKEGFFLETTLYDGAYYGSPVSILQDLQAGKSFLMVTDRPGACTIKKLIPAAILIWITVSSPAVIAQRLAKRGTETSDQQKQRLAIATQELEIEQAKPIFAYHVLNDNLDTAVHEIVAIIRKETHR